MSKGWWYLVQVMRRLWFRASLFAVIAIATALLGVGIGPLIPNRLSDMVGAKAVDGILTILASSMLTVTTFSLTTLVTATGAAAQSGTPRAISLLLQDRTAQTALSTFLGAFLFSLVGLIALNTDLYGGGGRLVLFVATLLVIALIVLVLLRWVDHLAGLGQVGETVRRLAEAAEASLRRETTRPCLGGTAYETLPRHCRLICHDTTGFVRHVDMSALARLAEQWKVTLYLENRPGDFVFAGDALAHIAVERDTAITAEDPEKALRAALAIGDIRNFDQDPIYALTALSEIGSRALSPGINDPGTAIDVLSQASRILIEADALEIDETPPLQRVHVRPLEPRQLVEAAFLAISRDGAGMIEVVLTLQLGLAGLQRRARPELAEAARALSAETAIRAHQTLAYESDKIRLDRAMQSLVASAQAH